MFDDEEPIYEVGYKKPPKKRQFKKGNKAAMGQKRKKKDQTISYLLLKILDEKFLVKRGDESTPMSNKEVIARSLVLKAQKGDSRALRYISELAGPAFMHADTDLPSEIRINFIGPKPIGSDRFLPDKEEKNEPVKNRK